MRKCLRHVVEFLTGNETWRPRSFSSGKLTPPMNFDAFELTMAPVLVVSCAVGRMICTQLSNSMRNLFKLGGRQAGSDRKAS